MFIDQNSLFLNAEHLNAFHVYITKKHPNLQKNIWNYKQNDSYLSEIAAFYIITGLNDYDSEVASSEHIYTYLRSIINDEDDLILIDYAEALENNSSINLILINDLSDEWQVLIKNAIDIKYCNIDLTQDKFLDVAKTLKRLELSISKNQIEDDYQLEL